MGGPGSGSHKSTESEKRTFASYAKFAARSIYAMAKDDSAPHSVRLDASKYILNRVYGMPSQSHDIGIQAEQMESATELLKKLSVNRERGDNGHEDGTSEVEEAATERA